MTQIHKCVFFDFGANFLYYTSIVQQDKSLECCFFAANTVASFLRTVFSLKP